MEKLNTEQLRKYIIQEVSKIVDILPDNYYFQKNNSRSNEGTYIYSDKIGYHIVYSEKGSENSHKITDNEFEISFWVLNSIVRAMAIDYMRKNIKSGENQREIIFNRELELLDKAGENYRKAGEIYISEILKKNPL
jgi:hypothetical protein